jgi:Mce-associated membrane protein
MRTLLRDRTVAILSGLMMLAVAAAAWSGWAWWSASQDDALRYAAARDEVLDTGRRLLVELNTVDFRNAEADLNKWRDATTGPLFEQLGRSRDLDLRGIQERQTVAGAGLLGVAVTDLNTQTGTATVIAALEIKVNMQGAEQSVTRSRLDADLMRTPDGWKISSLEVVGQGGAS